MLSQFDAYRSLLEFGVHVNQIQAKWHKYNQKYHIEYGQFSNGEILEKLYSDYDISSVLVEGGAKTLTAFIEEELYNQIIIYIAPKLFGRSKHELFQSSVSTMEEMIQLKLTDVEKLQSDLKLTYRRN